MIHHGGDDVTTRTRRRTLSLLTASAVAVSAAIAADAPAAGAATDRSAVPNGGVTVASIEGVAYAPIGGEWGPASTGDGSIAGSTGYRASYSWRVQPGSSTQVCAQGRGFDAQGHGHWYSLGCGASGRGTVPWGKILGNPQLRARSLNILTGGFVLWSSP
jgi:hypothetical protein